MISRISAIVLGLPGIALLFASDTLLPAFIPGFPASGVWLGQLLASAWLGLATLNWLQRNAVLGGIYGRPVVLANVPVYFISTLSLLRAMLDRSASVFLWVALLPAAVMAVTYAALLFRGPFQRGAIEA